MADAADVVAPAVDQSGNTVIWFVATIADLTAPKAATELEVLLAGRTVLAL